MKLTWLLPCCSDFQHTNIYNCTKIKSKIIKRSNQLCIKIINNRDSVIEKQQSSKKYLNAYQNLNLFLRVE